MPATLPNDFSAKTTITGSDLDENFEALKEKFGNINDEDLVGGAAITASKLSTIETDVSFSVCAKLFVDQTPGAINSTNGIAGLTYTTDCIFGVIPIPQAEDGTVTYNSASFVLNNPGSKDTVVSIRWGEIDSSGVFTQTTELESAVTLDDYTASASGTVVLGSTTNQGVVAIIYESAGTNDAQDAATDAWWVTLDFTKTFDSTNTG